MSCGSLYEKNGKAHIDFSQCHVFCLLCILHSLFVIPAQGKMSISEFNSFSARFRKQAIGVPEVCPALTFALLCPDSY
jgi:hypothetical protein